MKFYIVDDVIGIVKTLENIVESRNLGEVIGYQTDPEKAVDEIITLNPDIVMVDLLMSKMDGIALVSKVKESRPEIAFVMISRVNDKEMVEAAYREGVEFFINKPINVIEIERVLSNISEKLEMNSLVSNIKGMLTKDQIVGNITKGDIDDLKDINVFLGLLGMIGEKGTADIVSLCHYINDHGGSYNREALMFLAEQRGDSCKNIEQRMRRAIKKGLSNVASLGIDDYGNEIFQVYSNYVFDFKNIKDEMEFIKGKNNGGGRININKFIDGLLLYNNSKGR